MFRWASGITPAERAARPGRLWRSARRPLPRGRLPTRHRGRVLPGRGGGRRGAVVPDPGGGGEAPVEVRSEIFDVLETDAQPDRAGEHAARPALLLPQVGVRGGGRVAHQRAGVADVDGESEQLQGIAEGRGGGLSSCQVEGEHSGGAVGEVSRGESGVRPAGDRGVVDALHAGRPVQASGESGGVGADLAHAQIEGLDAHQDLLGAGGGERGPEIGDVLGARVGEQSGAAAVVVVREGDAEASVGRGEALPSIGTSPRIEAAGVHDQPRDGGAVAAEVLRGRMDHHVGPVLARAVQRRAGQGRVDHDRDVMGMGDRADRVEVHELRTGIGDGLDDHGAGIGRDRSFPRFQVPRVHAGAGHGQVSEGVIEELGGASVEELGGDDVAARFQQCAQCDGGGRLPAGDRDRSDPALEGGDALFEHSGGGVPGAGVGEALAAPGEEVLQRAVVVVRVGARAVDRRGDGAVHVLGSPARVDGCSAHVGLPDVVAVFRAGCGAC